MSVTTSGNRQAPFPSPQENYGPATAEVYGPEFLAFAGGFRRSRRGNLWRVYGGEVMTVFRYGDGTYGWSTDDGDGPRFNPRGRRLGSESEAVEGLWRDLTGLVG